MTTLARPGLWRTRNFRLLWTGETASMLGSAVASTALPLVAVVTLRASTFMVGLLAAAAWLPWLLVGLPAGAWVDRLPKRPVMLTCNAVSALVFGSVPAAALLGVLTMPYLLVAALLGGVAKVFFTLAYRAYLPALVEGGQLLEANTKLQGSESATEIAGPGLAGLLVKVFGPVSGILADSVSFAISVLCLHFVRARETKSFVEKRRLRTEIGDGLRFVTRDPYLRTLMIYGAVSNLAIDGYEAIQIVFLAREIGAGPGQIGFVLALAGVGGVCGALVTGRLAARFGTARSYLLGIGFGAPMLLLGPFASAGPGLVFFAVAWFGAGASVVVSNVLLGTFRQRYCPPELFGRITATYAVMNYGTIPLGAFLGGLLGEVLGVRQTMWLMGGVKLAAFGLVLFSPIRARRDFPARVS
ncbi:MFS transporter [Amycolatopsis sp. NPDC059027]|uniref:MFS transporter n=1 Tax=unclassified Amycolatopsis TaxID=2618356 RepID=UPI0036718B56